MPKQPIARPDQSTLNAGCWLALLVPAGIGVALAVVTGTWFPVVLALPAAIAAAYQLSSVALATITYIRWRREGIRGVLVYSRSPNWQSHIETQWLPRVGAQLKILNWSDRTTWRRSDPAVRLFHWFLGTKADFNPGVILLRPFRRPLVFRFYPAFRNAKHGNEAGLKALEERLFAELG